MKKIFLFTIFTLVLLGAGCALSVGGTISAKVGKENYDINDLNKWADISIYVENNLNTKVYYEDTACGTPVKIYVLKGNGWESTGNSHICIGMADGQAKFSVLKPGKSIIFSESVLGGGVYRAEFEYYLNKVDFRNKENILSVATNEFRVSRSAANLDSVIESCKDTDDPTESKLVECLYLSAKKAVDIQNLDLALDLCGKIMDRKSNFDGCYDGVALMLSLNRQKEKIEMVCRNYNTPERIQQCIDMAQ